MTVKAIRINKLAEVTGYSALTLRLGLQLNKFPFGTAFKSDESNGKYTYVLYPAKVKEYFGLTDAELKMCEGGKKNESN